MSDVAKRIRDLSPEKLKILLQTLNKQKENNGSIPMQKRGATNAFPLSFAQQRLWFLDQLEPGSSSYLVPNALRIEGKLDEQALEGALGALLERHESLRTTFEGHDGHPVQVIHPVVVPLVPVIDLHRLPIEGHMNARCLEQTLEALIDRHESLRTTFHVQDGMPIQVIHSVGHALLPVIDLQGLGQPHAEEYAQMLIQQEMLHPCDLIQGPLLRTALLRLETDHHVLLLTLHHLITDLWSNGVLREEFATLYQAFLHGESSPFAPLSIHYADYALWQREWLQGEILDRQLSYWRTQLAGISPLELPLDHPRPPLQTYEGASLPFRLSPALSDQLGTLSRTKQVTLFMLLLAAFQVLLARYSGQDDISVGTPISNRRHTELEKIVGFFLNNLVMRTNLLENPPFEHVLHRVRQVCLEAYTYQDIPFEKIVEEMASQRDISRSPLLQVMLILQQAPRTSKGTSATSTAMSLEEAHNSRVDLTLVLVEEDEGLHGFLEYRTDLFEKETMVRLLDHWQMLLQGIVNNPRTPISEIPLLTNDERELLLRDWNATQKAYPQELFTHQLFEWQAQLTPDAIALVDEHTHLTYEELNTHANQVAYQLQRMSVGPEMLVGVYMERSSELVIALLALFKVGGVYVPLDPTYPAERLAWICEDAQFGLVLTQADAAATLPSSHIPFLSLDTERSQWRKNPRSNLANQISGENLAYVIYTSGSTGRPKGAMIEHRGLLNHLYVNINEVNVTSNDRLAQTAALCFDISVWQLLAALLVGGCTVIYGPDVVSQPERLMKCVQADQISVFEPVPSFIQAMLDSIALESQGTYHLPNLRWLMPTGEALSPQLCRRWFASYPEIPLLNAYGPTECSDDVTFYPLTQAPASNALHIPIGRPVSNMRLYVLDQQQELLPCGIVGELYISGVGVGRGYLNNFQRTAETFLPDPFVDEPGTRMYKTGDRVRYMHDGILEFLGRVDQQVKVRGYRIELGEIEEALQVHPAIQEAVVLLREKGVGDQRLVAYIVLQTGERLSGKELRTMLQERLPVHMHPSTFVFLGALPLTPNGKIDRNGLSAREMGEGEEQQILHQEARTPQEELLLDLWREVLGQGQLGIHDNFFELGGHSLLMIRLLTRIRAVLGIEVSLRAVFEAPTVAGVAQQVELALCDGKGSDVPPFVIRERPEVLPLSFAQQRLWFLDQLEPGNTAYLIPTSLRIQERISIQTLEQSLLELISRHESLRTTFEERDGLPIQVIHLASALPLPVIDLQGIKHKNREQQAQWLARQQAQRSCDLVHGPLVRHSLIQIQEDEYVLFLTLHHIVTDGWSNQVLQREIVMLYQAFETGQPSPLAALPIQYADYALWQRQWLQGEVLEAQVAYWTRRLGGAPPLELPTDYPRPQVASSQGAIHAFVLSKELSHVLRALMYQEGVTLFMLLLAAFQVLFYRSTGQVDSVIGTDSANRHRGETEEIIGFFVNLLILCTDLSGNPPFRELLKHVRTGALEAYAHQDVPFELLVEKLASRRYLDRNPLVQVLFVLQNRSLELGQQGETESRIEQEVASQRAPISREDEETSVKFDLALFMQERAGELSGTLNYRLDLFSARTIATLIHRFEALLQSIVKQPDLPIDLLECLSDEERRQQEQEEREQRPELRLHEDGWLDLSEIDVKKKEKERKHDR